MKEKTTQKKSKKLKRFRIDLLITSVVSAITMLVNVLLKLILQENKFNHEQYKIMQNFYPEFKLHLLGLKMSLQKVEKHNVGQNMEEKITKYIEINSDNIAYRKNHPEEEQLIDSFHDDMDQFTIKFSELKEYLRKTTVPTFPIMHPYMKKKISCMLTTLDYYSLLWNKYWNKKMDVNILKTELENFEKLWNVEVSSKKIEEYILLLDEWLKLY